MTNTTINVSKCDYKNCDNYYRERNTIESSEWLALTYHNKKNDVWFASHICPECQAKNIDYNVVIEDLIKRAKTTKIKGL